MERSTVDIEDLLARFVRADPMPVSVARLCRLVGRPHVEIDDVVHVVERDQSLTAQLLRRANSAALGGMTRVGTVRGAALRLGPSSVVSLALGAAVSGLIRGSQPAYLMESGELWRRSVAASVAADVIRGAATVQLPVETSTAALLLDFGKLVLSRTLPVELVNELRLIHLAAEEQTDDDAAPSRGEAILEAERALLGFDHAEVGGRIVEAWRLPAEMAAAVAGHHATGIDRPAMSRAVSLAHAMVPDLCLNPSAFSSVVDTHGALLQSLGIADDVYPQLRITGIREFLEVARSLDAAA